MGDVRDARFALAKFRPPGLPDTLVPRPLLHDRLAGGARQRLTLVTGTAGAGKSVLLSSWAAARPPGGTIWMSCDEADVNPLRFWTGFIEAFRAAAPWFGADAADLLAMDSSVSADVIASLANDAMKLPTGLAVIVDDFHAAAAAVTAEMTELIEHWPATTVQLVLVGRADPPLRLDRMRMAGELCELRARDLYFTLAESHDLLASFGVRVTDDELATLHKGTEGWTAAVQMAALSLRGTADPERKARALHVRGQEIADYFVSEVLTRQPAELAEFMLDTSVLGELNAEACAAVTGREDAAAMLRAVSAAHLFLVPLDDERVNFRYHHLAHRLLHTELRARNPAREQTLHLRAAEWFSGAGDATRLAARHFLAARQADRALALMEDRVVPEFLSDPVMPAPLDLSAIDPSLLSDAPGRVLTVAGDLLLSGDTARGRQWLDFFERAQPPVTPASRLWARYMALRCYGHMLFGEGELAVSAGQAARAAKERTQPSDPWVAALPSILMVAYTWLEDFTAAEREAQLALASPGLPETAKRVMAPGDRSLVWFDAGHLKRAADMAGTASAEALRLGFDRHFHAQGYLLTLAGLALERRDLDAAEALTERLLSIAERRRPMVEFLALLARAQVWAARGQLREALASIDSARRPLEGAQSELLARADELEALLLMRLGDHGRAAELAGGLPGAPRGLLLARIALASGDHRTATEHLRSPSLARLAPRRDLVRRLLLAAAAVERGDPLAAGLMGGAIQAARQEGYLDTVVRSAPQVTSYLISQAGRVPRDPFIDQLIAASLDAGAAGPAASRPLTAPVVPLTQGELRILKLLPTSTYQQIAEILFISHNTVKTHLRSVYQKLGAESRSQAIQRAADLRLL